jgi:hypothetical protein
MLYQLSFLMVVIPDGPGLAFLNEFLILLESEFSGFKKKYCKKIEVRLIGFLG